MQRCKGPWHKFFTGFAPGIVFYATSFSASMLWHAVCMASRICRILSPIFATWKPAHAYFGGLGCSIQWTCESARIRIICLSVDSALLTRTLIFCLLFPRTCSWECVYDHFKNKAWGWIVSSCRLPRLRPARLSPLKQPCHDPSSGVILSKCVFTDPGVGCYASDILCARFCCALERAWLIDSLPRNRWGQEEASFRCEIWALYPFRWVGSLIDRKYSRNARAKMSLCVPTFRVILTSHLYGMYFLYGSTWALGWKASVELRCFHA